MNGNKAVLDSETLKNQEGGLTDDQQELIELQFEEDQWKQHERKDTEVQILDEEEEEEEIKSEPETEELDSEKDTQEEVEGEKEQKKEVEEEVKSGADKAELTEEQKAEAFAAEVKAFAQAENLSEEEAKEELLGQHKILEKYNSDPKKLSKAYRHLQRLYSENDRKLKEFEEAAKAPKPGPGQIAHPFKRDESGYPVIVDKEDFDAELVEAYRAEYKRLTEDKDDEEVLEMAIRDIRTKADQIKKNHFEEMQQRAQTKREELVASIPETEKEYLEEVKAVIDNTHDGLIVSDGLSVPDLIAWAKGKKFDEKIKEAEERGYKRGKEEAVILGETEPTGKGSSPSGKKSSLSVSSLTDEEKERALDMYDSAVGVSDEEKFKMYLQYKKDTEKEN